MRPTLLGPWLLEAASLSASARTALSEAGPALRAGHLEGLERSPRADQPGLYLVVDEGARPLLVGFWLVFGPAFLDDGPPGPPERVPPYAAGLLDAVTEEVWWKNLPVADSGAGRWRPVIVLEWPAALAVRSSAAPPGVPAAPDSPRGGGAREEEGWLESRLLGRAAAPKVEVEEERAGPDPFAGLPERRGLVTVIQGDLHYTRALHTGSWRLVPRAALGPPGPALVPLESWLEAAREPVSAAPAGGEVGPPLGLPGGRVGFPMDGWLTRALERWPDGPEPAQPGALAAREVQTKWVGQIARALSSMLAVLIGVGGLATGVRLLAEPRPEALAVTPTPAPQPAMSVCSADHQAFVDELRCQVRAMASASDPGAMDPVCGDAGGPGAGPDAGEDLQAEWCGLLDRELDGWLGNRVQSERTYNFGALALSQACFNVLGRPFPYTQPTGYSGGAAIADPSRFLDDSDLSIASLVAARDQLKSACELYRGRVEARVEGAVLATHIGAAYSTDPTVTHEGEPSALRRALVSQATASLGAEASRCFQAGVAGGPAVSAYRGLCGAPDSGEEKLEDSKIWRQLRGENLDPSADVVRRYAASRFGLASGAPSKTDSGLWQCHLTLTGALAATVGGSTRALWDLRLPVPTSYGGGGVMSQLVLDSGMRAFEAGLNAGVCWDLVRRRLIAYPPAHPLLEPLDEDGWPSVEQRLCGQICASTYRIAEPKERDAWLTPKADLALCLRHDAPSDTPDLGRDTLDQLRLPPTGRAWQSPTDAQICAFNLVAEGYFPEGDEGAIVGGRSPVEWAGETAPGSRIAGGIDGLAADAIRGMSRYGAGTGWSVGRCGYVATQCFAELLLEVTGDRSAERYEWLPHWNAAIDSLATARPAELNERHPWCAPLQPYLGEVSDMAQIDTPCRRGVELARQNVERAARSFAAGSNGGPK